MGELNGITEPDWTGLFPLTSYIVDRLLGSKPADLKPDQYRAYNIVTWHLEQALAEKKPPPLQIIIHGKGRTGKFKVIQTITDEFEQ